MPCMLAHLICEKILGSIVCTGILKIKFMKFVFGTGFAISLLDKLIYIA